MSLAGLHVGLVGPLPPPAGGMANQTRQLAELLRDAQAHVSLVQSNAPYRPVWAGRVPVFRALFRLVPYLLLLWRVAGRSDVLHVMANSGWSWHLFAAPAIWIARCRQVPVVVNYRGGEAAEFLVGSQRAVRWSIGSIARLIVPSGFLQQVFSQFGMASEIVPNIVDLRRFRPACSARPDSPQLLVARNLEAIYDNATALHAFVRVAAQVPTACLTIAGTGPERAALEALAQQLGVAGQVRFAGRLEREAMAALMRECAVALNPSRVDNTPNSVLEAWASGVPVVSTNVGGVPFIAEHGVTALLVPPQDPEAMANAVLQVLTDPSLARQLSVNGLVEVQRYTWERVAPRLAEVYRAAINRSHA